ncbi:MAG: hypothetical protein QOD80_1138 [Verrucomicrobiota bacterium]|jgi:hypothetical protein
MIGAGFIPLRPAQIRSKAGVADRHATRVTGW